MGPPRGEKWLRGCDDSSENIYDGAVERGRSMSVGHLSGVPTTSASWIGGSQTWYMNPMTTKKEDMSVGLNSSTRSLLLKRPSTSSGRYMAQNLRAANTERQIIESLEKLPFKICNLSDYSVLAAGPLLSHSVLSSVYVSKTASKLYVVKQVTKQNAEKIESLLHEAAILTHLSNVPGCRTFVVGFHGIDMGVECNMLPALIFDKMDCSLQDWTKQNLSTSYSRRASQLKVVLGSITLQLTGALGWIHDQGAVTHGDIKPSNILVRQGSDKSGSKNFTLCFADFASACIIHEPKLAHTGLTFAYMAPEKLRAAHDPPTTGGDVWALAVSLLEIVAGRVPYSDVSPRVRKLAAIGNGEPLANVEEEVGNADCKEFAEKVLSPALTKSPHDRINAEAWSALAFTFFFVRGD